MPNKKVAIEGNPPAIETTAGGFSVPSSRPPSFSFTVAAGDPGERLDAYLARRRTDVSRSQFKKLIQDGAVQVNGQVVKPRHLAAPGDRIEVRLPIVEGAGQLAPEEMPLDILHEDDEILVVNKAAGVVVHPGAGHPTGTLVHGLLSHSPKLALQGSPLRPGIVHRLDQDTSGALVVAKTEAAYLDLIRQFKGHQVSKRYLALVYGRFAESRGRVAAAIARHPGNRKKMAVLAGGRAAVSHWRVLEDLGPVSFIEVRIETGRTHQIRVHLSHLGHPVVGDALYGGGRSKARAVGSLPIRQLLLERVSRQMLHAQRLEFDHPASGRRIGFEAPLPIDFADLLAALRSTLQPPTAPN